MKSYKITVNGQSYDVTVEEVGAVGAGQPPVPRPVAAVAAGAVAAAAPKAVGSGATATPAAAGGAVVKAPMPGTLLAYKVAQGQAVKKGDVLLILEAMKWRTRSRLPSTASWRRSWRPKAPPSAREIRWSR